MAKQIGPAPRFLTALERRPYHALNGRSVTPERSPIPEGAGGCMDFTLTPEQQSFRDEVRDWLERNLPRSWVERLHGGSDIPRPDAYEFLRQWQGELNQAGVKGVPGPKEAGGRGPNFIEQMFPHDGMARATRPPGPATLAE